MTFRPRRVSFGGVNDEIKAYWMALKYQDECSCQMKKNTADHDEPYKLPINPLRPAQDSKVRYTKCDFETSDASHVEWSACEVYLFASQKNDLLFVHNL